MHFSIAAEGVLSFELGIPDTDVGTSRPDRA
jgi:hypothetical protein